MPFCCHRREYTFSSPSCEKKIHFQSQIKNRNLTKRSYITARHNSGSFEQSRYFQPTSGLLGNHPWWPIIFGGKKWFDRLETEQLFLQNFFFDKKALFLISIGIYKGTSWALFLVSLSSWIPENCEHNMGTHEASKGKRGRPRSYSCIRTKLRTSTKLGKLALVYLSRNGTWKVPGLRWGQPLNWILRFFKDFISHFLSDNHDHKRHQLYQQTCKL